MDNFTVRERKKFIVWLRKEMEIDRKMATQYPDGVESELERGYWQQICNTAIGRVFSLILKLADEKKVDLCA